MATQAGIPNVIIDGSGWLIAKAHYDTFTYPCGLVRYAKTIPEAIEKAQELYILMYGST